MAQPSRRSSLNKNMSFEKVSERLAALQENNSQLKDLIDKLASIKFQPGSIPLDDEEDNVKSELVAEIHQTISELDEESELIFEKVNDLASGKPGSELQHQKAGLVRGVERAIGELKKLQREFRRAQVSAKRNLEEAQRLERELLIQSYSTPPADNAAPVPRQQRRSPVSTQLSKEDKEVNASTDVTLALRRTHDMMAAELSRSQFAHDTLQESTAALAQLSESYSTLETLLSSSKNLLGTLLRSQKSDTWYLETAFYILSATIAWLVFRRLIYGPMWLLLWFPSRILRIFYNAWVGVFTAIGLTAGTSVESSVSQGISSESVVYASVTRASRPTGAAARLPNINVGGGGRGAPMRPPDRPQGQETMSEQVGKIIDESQSNHGEGDAGGQTQDAEKTVKEDNTEDDSIKAEKNPKKRMWEEDVEAAKEAQIKKDEL